MMTSRELVKSTLEFTNTSQRVPRQMWTLPWAEENYTEELAAIARDFPSDFGGVPFTFKDPPKTVGDPCKVGTYIDEWGCRFTNIQSGVIGEVKTPLIPADDAEWNDTSAIHIPEETLTFDIDEVNAGCAKTDKFVTGGCCPRPFEQLQFIRGTENLYIDLMDPPPKMMEFIKRMHDLYCRQLTKWAKTDVDGLNFMDDWGSQKSLLINPQIWCEIFKPLYKDYIDIAHSYGKKIFMHSDGHTLAIYPHLIELGLDAFNSQIFCIGLENLEQFKGRITFWGELDRQHLLPYGTEEDVENAVKDVYGKLWSNGGCIAQLEFGAGAKPANVRKAFETWDSLRKDK